MNGMPRTIEVPIGQKLSDIEKGTRLSGEWRNSLPETEMRKLSTLVKDVGTPPTESENLPALPAEETEQTRVEVLPSSFETFLPEVSRSVKLINDSASALHSHMHRILDTTDDVRPTIDRTEQAVACAREIAVLIKAQSDLIRTMR